MNASVTHLAGPLPAGVVFHGSDRRFNGLDASDCLGMHFGTMEAAVDRLRTTGRLLADLTPVESADGSWMVEEDAHSDEPPVMHGPFEDEDSAQTFTMVYDASRTPEAFAVTLKAPLMLEDLGQWTFNSVFQHLAQIDILDDEAQRDAIWNAWQTSDKAGWQALRAAIEQRGFDSIAYRNDIEDKGSFSWIAFHGHQVACAPESNSQPQARPGFLQNTPPSPPQAARSKRMHGGANPGNQPATIGEQVWERVQADPIEEVMRWIGRDHPGIMERITRLTVIDHEYRLDRLSEVVPEREMRQLPALEHSITIWRGLPTGAQIRPGDWISLSRDYAESHGDRTSERPHVDELPLVQCSDIYWAGTDMREFFYLPHAWRAHGKSPEQYLQSLSRDMLLALADGELHDLARHKDAIAEIYEHATDGSRDAQAHVYHGPDHWMRVMRHSVAASRSLGISPLVPYIFGLVHDSKRMSDDLDPEHGPRAAAFVREQRESLFAFLSDADIERLALACDQHSDGVTHGEAHVLACFDADRLDLGRVGICPDPLYLCTSYAKQSAVIRQALRISGASDLEDEVQDDSAEGAEEGASMLERFR